MYDACTLTLPRFKLEVLADSVHHFVMSVSSICICRMPSLSPTLTTGPSPSDPTTSVRTDCRETSQRMSTAWWLEGNIYNAMFGPQPCKVTCGFHNTLHWTYLKSTPRYQSRKRRPFSRYTARADKVRREKSFAAGPGPTSANLEEQLTDIRGSLVTIQAENSALRRNIEAVKGKRPKTLLK